MVGSSFASYSWSHSGPLSQFLFSEDGKLHGRRCPNAVDIPCAVCLAFVGALQNPSLFPLMNSLSSIDFNLDGTVNHSFPPL